MDERFEHVTRMSGGWEQVRLTLAGPEATIEYDSDAMGQGPLRYVLRCAHERRSDFHGVLHAVSLEQSSFRRKERGGHELVGTERVDLAQRIDPRVDDDEMREVLRTIDIEYVRVPEPQARLEEPGGMGGVHAWTDTFVLVSLIRFTGWWYAGRRDFASTPLGRGLEALDKMPFAIANGIFVIGG